MPEVSRFYGISILLYYRDHLPPHFHAVYGDDEVVIRLSDLGIEDGWLPKRALRLVQEWAQLHHAELVTAWEAARAQVPLGRIEPLE